MSLNLHNITFGYPSRDTLFRNASLSVAPGEKASLVGDNGSGKSTLLQIIAGNLTPLSGEASHDGRMWFVPQHFGQYDHLTVAGALGIEDKITALKAILDGSANEDHFAVLDDDWTVEENAVVALSEWGLGGNFSRNADGGNSKNVNSTISGSVLDRLLSTLSGGEKTKVFLAGIALHSPALVLMDEPTNHLDAEARQKLYDLIGRSHASMLIVSHDRMLLNLVETTWELSANGAERFGGNYDHYRELRDARLDALEEQIGEKEKALRLARRTVRETLERQARRESKGAGKASKEGVPRIMMKTLKDSADATSSRLKGAHAAKMESIESDLRQKRAERPQDAMLKIKLNESPLYRGKTLVEGAGVNFSYGAGNLWPHNLDFRIGSGDRIVIRGGNGSGKTTLARLIQGELEPTEGLIRRSDGVKIMYIDQQYSLVDDNLTVAAQADAFNKRNLPDHAVKTELHRFLFPAETWDKPCAALSGGEKMKLVFCSLLIGDDAPDMFILDEPTNNLDIRSLELVTSVLKEYGGTIVVISHDGHFIDEIGTTKDIAPGNGGRERLIK